MGSASWSISSLNALSGCPPTSKQRTFVKVCGRQHTRHGVIFTHLLENLDEEADLDLGGLLQKSIQSCGALGLAQDAEPLLNCTKLVLEVLVQSSSGHLLQRRLVLVNIRNPLLGNLVLRIAF